MKRQGFEAEEREKKGEEQWCGASQTEITCCRAPRGERRASQESLCVKPVGFPRPKNESTPCDSLSSHLQ